MYNCVIKFLRKKYHVYANLVYIYTNFYHIRLIVRILIPHQLALLCWAEVYYIMVGRCGEEACSSQGSQEAKEKDVGSTWSWDWMSPSRDYS